MIRLISIDIQKNKTIYHLKDQESIDDFNNREVDSKYLEFTNTKLGIEYIKDTLYTDLNTPYGVK